MTIDQTDVLRVPSKVFAIQIGVVDRDVLALPERVLRQDSGVVYLNVLAILEHVFGIAVESIDKDVFTEHKGIGTSMQGDILQTQAIDLPERFVGIGDIDILKRDVVHLTEEFRAIDTTTTHDEVVGIPDSRTRAHCEITVLDEGTIDVPPGILAIESALAGLHILTLLDATLTICNGDILQSQVVGGKKGALTAEFLVFN